MRVAIVGATGLVGQEMLAVLQELEFPVSELIPVASDRSAGRKIAFNGGSVSVVTMAQALELRPDIALFSAGGGVSRDFAPQFTALGTVVIDNSSAWRMEPHVPLVVPEINADAIGQSKLIANPNCSTIQLVMALKPLHEAFGLRRVVVSTYQSVTGTGKNALDQMLGERVGDDDVQRVYPHRIDMNCLPHCDVFQPNGYTREEMKVVHESRKILNLPDLAVTCTAVRVPVMGGHSESVNLEFERPVDVARAREVLAAMPGVVVQDNPNENLYPMPATAHRRNEVFVGRIRRDESVPHGLNLWIVADNLRKGAATNAVQIAHFLLAQQAPATQAQIA
jgi:aspartate-semialdehyde dehydrogenase